MNHNIQVKDAWQGSNSARKRLATAFQKKLGPISKSLKFDKEKCRPAERPHLTQVLQCLTAKWAAVMILYILYSTKSGYGNSIILNKYIIFYSCIIHNYEHYMMYIYNICVACNIYIYINISWHFTKFPYISDAKVDMLSDRGAVVAAERSEAASRAQSSTRPLKKQEWLNMLENLWECTVSKNL